MMKKSEGQRYALAVNRSSGFQLISFDRGNIWVHYRRRKGSCVSNHATEGIDDNMIALPFEMHDLLMSQPTGPREIVTNKAVREMISSSDQESIINRVRGLPLASFLLMGQSALFQKL
jgi:hypothetical protein